MSDLLKQPHRNGFCPESADEYLALQRARQAAGPHQSAHILATLAKTRSLPIRFRGSSRLCAIKVQRREVAVAVFSGLKPDFVQTRHLTTDAAKAESSALAFIHWVLENLEIDSTAVEQVEARHAASRRNLLTDSLRAAIRGEALPLCEPSKKELLASFAIPEPKTRKEVRRIVCGIWPILETMRYSPAILDAVALGLYAQARRLINN